MPKKVKDGDKITAWLATQPAEIHQEFKDLFAKYYYSIPVVHDYLTSRGCHVSLATLYRWRSQNVVSAAQASLLNASTQEYSGINALGIAEALLAQLYKVTEQYSKIIDENKEEISLQQAIAGLPNTVREIRSLTQQVQTTTWHLDYESAILQGAARIMEVALQTAKDTAEEPYTIKLLEDSMLRVKEELKKVTP